MTYSDSPGSPRIFRLREPEQRCIARREIPFKPCAFNNARYAMHSSYMWPLICHVEKNVILMVARPTRLPVDMTLGISYERSTADCDPRRCSRKKHRRYRGNIPTSRDNLRFLFELTRRNLSECASKQTARNKTLQPYPVFHSDQQALVYKPYQDSDGPNPNFCCR